MRLFTGLFTYSVVLLASRAVPAADTPRPAIGVVLSTGQFQVAHTPGTGTATVLSGDEVDSAANTSRVMLKNGNELALAPHSSGSFYGDHANLLDGEIHVKSAAPLYITSRNFVVTPTAGSQAILQTDGSKLTVNIASGGANVTSSQGESLAHMTAGSTLAFDSLPGLGGAPSGAPAAVETNASNANVHLLGVLTTENGHYLLRDRYSNKVFEISGKVTSKMVDRLVTVDGTWIGNEKSEIAQVDHYVQASRIAPSDAALAAPCLPDGAGGALKSIVLNGVVSKIRNHFLVNDAKQGTYEIVGDVQDKEVGTDLHEKGFILPQREAIRPAEKVVYVEARKFIVAASPCVGMIVGGSIITAGALVLPKNAEPVVQSSVAHPISF